MLVDLGRFLTGNGTRIDLPRQLASHGSDVHVVLEVFVWQIVCHDLHAPAQVVLKTHPVHGVRATAHQDWDVLCNGVDCVECFRHGGAEG